MSSVAFVYRVSRSARKNLIHPIKTMNWTSFPSIRTLTYEQIVFLTTLGPNAHPHSALLP